MCQANVSPSRQANENRSFGSKRRAAGRRLQRTQRLSYLSGAQVRRQHRACLRACDRDDDYDGSLGPVLQRAADAAAPTLRRVGGHVHFPVQFATGDVH